MSKQLKLKRKKISLFMEEFYRKYPKVEEYHKQMADICREIPTGPDDTITLPRGMTPTTRGYTLKAKEGGFRGGSYFSNTEAKNYPIQGFATGDLVPMIINLYTEFDEHALKYLVCTVHDSCLLDIEVDNFYTTLRGIERAISYLPKEFKSLFDYDLTTRISYDITYGTSWKDMTALSRDGVISILKTKRLLDYDYDSTRHYN